MSNPNVRGTLTEVDPLDALRDYLVECGIVRIPRNAGALPPAWVYPRDGLNAPGEGKNPTEKGTDAVVGLFPTSAIPKGAYEGFLRNVNVDIRYRVRSAPLVRPLDNAIRVALHDKIAWDMAGLTVLQSLQVRELQPLGADTQSYDYVTEYQFEVWA
jgi:hypothetical protein